MDLIITAATGYKANQLFPFLDSVKQHCRNVSVAIIVHKKDTQLIQELNKAYSFLDIISLDKKDRNTVKLFRTVNNLLLPINYFNDSRLLSSLRHEFLHIALRRYFIALDIIRSSRDNISNVLLTDSRDVIFQGNPFSIVNGKLLSGLESDAMSVQSCSINSTWVRCIYGEEGLRKIGDQRIVCSGVTIGPTEKIESYLVEMCSEMEAYLPKIASSDSIDQGIHNYLIGTNRITVETVDSRSGCIATLGYEDPANLHLDEATGQIRVYDQFPVIVHQYDRHPSLLLSLTQPTN